MMSLQKILSLGILLVFTAGILSRDRAVSLEKTIKKQVSQQSIAQNDTNIMAAEPTESSQIVNSQTKFGLKLLQEIIQQNPEANTFISPFSVGVALSMLYNGAEETTQTELASLLEIVDLNITEVNQGNQNLTEKLVTSDPEVKIAIANSLWTKLGFSIEQSFLDTNQRYYNATIQELDFSQPESSKTINNWVAENTQNKIPEIVDQINPEQALFLINAIYFKGQWQSKFNPDATKEQDFYLVDGQVKKHPLMFKFGEYKYYENPEFQLVSLPYGSGHLAMNIFLPKQTSNLKNFLTQLNSENLDSWLKQMSLKEGKIQIPRFKQEHETNLNNILQQLGAASIFNPNQANFANLSDQSLAVDTIKHKAVIEVNEEGTEAAATTSIGIVATSVQTPFNMIVNRPFFYTIQDSETGAILFMGTIQNPEQ
jgi:serine protease inhibitor